MNTFGRSPLFYAISAYSTDVLEKYLEENAYSVNEYDWLGDTPLIHALKQYNPDESYITHRIVFYLLKHGANPNMHKSGSPTPLMLATLLEDAFLIQSLLMKGADGNARLGEDGIFFQKNDTALSLAVRMNGLTNYPNRHYSMKQLECIQYLIQYTQIPLNPNTIFHAIQQTKQSELRKLMKNYIIMLRSTSLELPAI